MNFQKEVDDSQAISPSKHMGEGGLKPVKMPKVFKEIGEGNELSHSSCPSGQNGYWVVDTANEEHKAYE